MSAQTSSPSGVSSTSNKYRNVILNSNYNQPRDDSEKPSNSSSSVTSNIGTALAVLAKNNHEKQFLTNSISLHGDVSSFIHSQLNNSNKSHLSSNGINENETMSNINGKGKIHFFIQPFYRWSFWTLFIVERTLVHQTVSLTLDDSTQQISAREISTDIENTKVKMREHTSKKKKGLRDLTSRISLPPEIKNGFSLQKQLSSTNNNNNNNNNSGLHHTTSGIGLNNKFKLNYHPLHQHQRSSYYQTNSISTQALDHILHQSNSSLLRLSPSQLTTSTSGQLSRNEQRLSMLDLGFGKIESYVKLEKLGEGSNWISTIISLYFIDFLIQERMPLFTKANLIYWMVSSPWKKFD